MDFIASLMPVYLADTSDMGSGAICLESGTRIEPLDGPGDEDVCVRVSFSGTECRQAEVPASLIGGLAIGRYVQIACISMTDSERAEALRHFAEHFHFKTGVHAYLPNLPDPEDRTKKMVQRIARWTARVAVGSL